MGMVSERNSICQLNSVKQINDWHGNSYKIRNLQFLKQFCLYSCWMQPLEDNLSLNSSSINSSCTQVIQNISNISQYRASRCQQISTITQHKDFETATMKMFDKESDKQISGDNSFYSECEQIKLQQSLDDELILEKKVQKKDIILKSGQLKDSWVRHFTEVIYGFLKQPSDFSFSLAIERLKYYQEETPFQSRASKAQSCSTDKQNSSFNSSESSFTKKVYSTVKTSYSEQDSRIEGQSISVQSLLKAMFYENQHQFMIYSFDYVFCHLTFISSMLYFWARLDHVNQSENLTFLRPFTPLSTKMSPLLILKPSKNNFFSKNNTFHSKTNLFKTLKYYITQRSQSLNISQINILIVYFFLSYLKTQFFDETIVRDIVEIQESFINSLKLFRRIKRMEKEFNSTSNQFVLESQLHKYEYENKLIESIEKTFLIFQFLNTHNFVSTPLQKYYQLNEFDNSKKLYHLKRDHFCIWVMKIILHLCEKKSAESISKSAYYIITFLAILKKFKENKNFEGISMILPILFNIKEQLPKVWGYAVNRRKQINDKLKEYSQTLTKKIYKKEDIPKNCNAIISEDVIYEMCQKFEKYAKIDKKQTQATINLQKHKKFFQEFLVHIVYHKKEIMQVYRGQIQEYKKEKEIGISFNMYLIDSYVCRSERGTNSKILWKKLTEKCKKVNEIINYNVYIDIIDYCFVGSALKYRQLDI